MEERLDYGKIAPGAMKAMYGLGNYLKTTDLEPNLQELVKIRASQINECAYCIDMHWKDARMMGESEQRLYGLNAWRESPYYSDRERAALLWTENLTRLSQSEVSDEVYAQVSACFSEKDLVDLTLAIVLINGWNRFAKPFRDVPGSYEPKPTK